MSTIWPLPTLARVQRRKSKSISSSRPTSEVNAAPRNASNRLATALDRSTCQAGTGAATPLNLDGSEIAVLEEVAGQPLGARGDDDSVRLGSACRRAARFGASPTTDCS